MVTEEAPRLFAVVQVYGEQLDGWIVAWGIAFEGRAEVVGVDERTRISLNEPERAALAFRGCPDVTTRLVWADPTLAARPDGGEPTAS
ncbi:hypothetical protein BJF78_15790 [Pseudonocardia sp. CNS-139]|nr:hypothetical protein BJF78_15790 [Pseudonocardia sp. CNS-139]